VLEGGFPAALPASLSPLFPERRFSSNDFFASSIRIYYTMTEVEKPVGVAS
jgi:hypothetical protein